MIGSQHVLVLSTGFEPLYKTNWKRAITAVFSGRAEVLETHATLKIKTSSGSIKMPTVVRCLSGIIAARIRHMTRSKKPSKKTLWVRDQGKCRYCLDKVSLKESTVDHVIPKSRSGGNTWENLVIACKDCNQKKGSRLPKECNMFPVLSQSARLNIIPAIT